MWHFCLLSALCLSHFLQFLNISTRNLSMAFFTFLVKDSLPEQRPESPMLLSMARWCCVPMPHFPIPMCCPAICLSRWCSCGVLSYKVTNTGCSFLEHSHW